MAFGFMIKKWGILACPLSIKLKHIKHLAICFLPTELCITEHLLENWQSYKRFFVSGKPVIVQPMHVKIDSDTQHL